MNPTQAIAIASQAISAPIGRGTSWMVIGPYYSGRPDGPYTEAMADSYWKARHLARQWRIGHALALMGKAEECDDYPTGMPWRTVVYRYART